jgi:putative membrane protein insertion efficiency factor
MTHNTVFKKFFIAPIQAYQYISRMLPGSCRYYPTCSEYAKWQFEFNSPHRALVSSTLRIARCNQLFPGGIDYPVVDWNPQVCPTPCKPKQIDLEDISFWLVPKDTKRYIVIKVFKNE